LPNASSHPSKPPERLPLHPAAFILENDILGPRKKAKAD
jgi:hypothetical protein